MFNALTASLIAEFQVTAAQLGQLSAFYFYAVIPLIFPAGILLDRISTRKIIVIAMLLLSFATLIFSLTHSFSIIAICRFVTGIGGTFCLLSCVRLATRWFPPQRMALVIGLIVTMAMIGGVVAQTPVTWLIAKIGWRATVFWDGMLGFVFTAIIFLVVRDYPPDFAKEQQQFQSLLNELGFWPSLRMALANLQNWLGGVFTSLMNLPIFLLGSLWGNLYLVQAHQFNQMQASYITSMIFIGAIIGSPLLGWISDRIGLRRLPMIVCAIFSLIVILLIMFLTLNLIGAMLLFLLLGIFTSGQIISYPLIAESNSRAITGTAEGIASVLIMAGGLAQPLFGWLMGVNWNHHYVNNVPFYSVGDYRLAMSIMPVGFVLALLAAWVIKETFCKAQN